MRESGRCQVALDHVRLAAELMAHRVRNPLNSIVLVLELIRRDVAGEPEHRNLDTIQGEVEQLEKRLQKFLDMVRRREHRPEVVDLVTVVEVVCELLFGPARDARVTVRQQLHVSSARVRGDEVELLRAVLGPCAAALRKSSPGAELKVGLDSDQREHLVFVECPELEPGSIALTVAEELVAGSGGALTYDDPRHPTRLTYRFPAGPSAEPSPR
jgi:signal transduction histidine kinase